MMTFIKSVKSFLKRLKNGMRAILGGNLTSGLENLSANMGHLNVRLEALSSNVADLSRSLSANSGTLNPDLHNFWPSFEDWSESMSMKYREKMGPEFIFVSEHVRSIMRDNSDYIVAMYASMRRVNDQEDYIFAAIVMFIIINKAPYGTHRDELKLLKMVVVPRKFIEISIVTFSNKASIVGFDRDVFSKVVKKSLICLQYDKLIEYNNVFRSRRKSNVEIEFKFKNIESMVLKNSSSISSKPFKSFEHGGIVYTHSDSFESLHEVKITKSINRNTASFNIETCLKLSRTKLIINKKYTSHADMLIHKEVLAIKKELADMGLWSNMIVDKDNYSNIKEELKKLRIKKAIITTNINNAKDKAKKLDGTSKKEMEEKAKSQMAQKKKIKHRISKISSSISKIMFMEATRELFKLDYYYVQHILDFRGRIYSNSILSPTFNKTIRPLICLEQPIDVTEITSSIYYKKLCKILDISDLNEYYKALIKIDIGKIYSKEIIKENNKNSISAIEFIKKADKIIQNHSREESHLDLDEKILLHILLTNVKKNNESKPFDDYIPGMYDSTASGQQVL